MGNGTPSVLSAGSLSALDLARSAISIVDIGRIAFFLMNHKTLMTLKLLVKDC